MRGGRSLTILPRSRLLRGHKAPPLTILGYGDDADGTPMSLYITGGRRPVVERG